MVKLTAVGGTGYAGTPENSLLKGGGGDDTSGGMEARLAKLEAQMEHIQADVAKLTGIPAEMAAMRERMNHLPTKAEMKADIDAAADRAGVRMQRTVAVVGGLLGIATVATGVANYFIK